MSDYYNAYIKNGTENCYDKYCLNWLTIDLREWSMTRSGYYSGYTHYRSWYLGTESRVHTSEVLAQLDVRPTFFLTSDVLYKSGTGSIENPIILDTNPLVVNKVEASSVTSSSITLNITTNDNDLVDTYYYKCNDAGSYLESSSNTPTCSELTAGTTYNISVYVKDKFGHTSEVKTVSLKTVSPAGNYILNSLKPSGLNTTMEGGLYRFQGTNDTVNNYICFGTLDKSTCVNDTDKYMYRIIGINSNGQLKLIKKEALNIAYRWQQDYTINTSWENTNLFNGLNDSLFLNSNYISKTWNNKIATTAWKYGDTLSVNYSAIDIYSIENNWNNITNAKVTLMYVHDYYYAYQSGGLNCSGSGEFETCKTSWLFIGNSDLEPYTLNEWTMARYGYLSDYNLYVAWNVVSNGRVGYPIVQAAFSVRPTFFLTPDVQFMSGSGTLADPILIN